MKKTLITLAALVIAAGALQAATVVQTQTFGGTPNLTTNLTFNKFNIAGQTLTQVSVQVFLNTDSGAYLRIDNDGGAGSGTASFGAEGLFKAFGAGTTVHLSKQSDMFSTFSGALNASDSHYFDLGANDGDTEVGGTASFSYTGTDYGFWNIAATSANDSDIINSMVYGEYTGSGTYTLAYAISQYMNLGTISGAQTQADPVGVNGSVVVTYNYIPEPATASMSVLVLVAGFWIRRRFLA